MDVWMPQRMASDPPVTLSRGPPACGHDEFI